MNVFNYPLSRLLFSLINYIASKSSCALSPTLTFRCNEPWFSVCRPKVVEKREKVTFNASPRTLWNCRYSVHFSYYKYCFIKMAFVTHMACRGLATSAQRMSHIKQITVLGGGQMGAGIAQVSLLKFLIVSGLALGIERKGSFGPF